MIRLDDVHKQFGPVAALSGLSLDIPAGTIYSLLGPNGAGKTTTINALLGFVEPDRGRVTINSIDVKTQRMAARRQVTYIPEQVQLYPRLTGLENLRYFHELSGAAALELGELRRCLFDAGLQEGAIDRPVGDYSKGMRQKVGIAIALARRAPAMLLDEPTSGLDPHAAREFGESLRWLAGQGVAILMATHDLFRAREVAHRIGILNAGCLVEDLLAADIDIAALEPLYIERIHGNPG
ncbi:MAG: ABC transporter ATP-binding protein [Chromatiales bacterium]|nr:ABC transporter ATP-binding protein [Chromatiales bacterium]